MAFPLHAVLAKTGRAADLCLGRTIVADHCCAAKGRELERLAQQSEQRRVLQIVLVINAAMFVAEFGAGLVAGSTALMADAVDMLGDAIVYGISIYALTRSARWKGGAALVKGLFILAFGVVILIEVAVKLASGVPPSSALMLVFGGLAFAANLVCLRLLWRFRGQDVNMSSTFECSRNDVISNAGVLVAAGGVALFASPWPDLIIGAVIAALFLRSALGVIRDALPVMRAA
ncbi:cation transporter [Sphingomonas sp. ID0503]|uniref:cation transporter n=1 Tax=Sphingomonas sp. ID0503 TaxID=3399691 RepID=UPI003AFA2C7C